jgi:hypothetical protein
MFFMLVLLSAESLPEIKFDLNVQKSSSDYEEILSDNSFRLIDSPGRTTSSQVEILKWEYQEESDEDN